MIFWALCNVTIDLALHTIHNQHRSTSDHMYKVDNTHDDNTLHTQISFSIPQMGQDLFPVALKKFKSQAVESNDLDHILSEECPGSSKS